MKKTSHDSREGSVLLLTLLVVSLLLVLVLGFVVIVRLELREATARQQQVQAEYTAKLGVEMAVAQLQQLTGPDQRITARADLFDSSHTNFAEPTRVAVSEKSKWVGVWDASGYDEFDPSIKPFLGWMVSGIPSATDASSDIQNPFTASETLVTLVGAGTVLEASDQVKVPLVPVGNGNMAWWVKDENINARFDTSDPYRNSPDPLKRQFSLHSAQRYGIELLQVDNGTPGTPLGDTLFPYENTTFTNLIERVASLAQAPLIWQNIPAHQATYETMIGNRYHDLSLVSRGLLVDVRNGGLRRDLTLAFEMPYDDWVDSAYVSVHPDAEIPPYQPAGYPINRKIAPVFKISDFSPYGISPDAGKLPVSPPPVPYGTPTTEQLRMDTAATADPVLKGPTWDLFRNYYRLYKAEDSDLEEFGFSDDMNLQSDGSLRARSLFPAAHGLGKARRYGGDPLVWDYAETIGPKDGIPTADRYTLALPMGRPVLPAISPVVTRLQTVISYRTRPSDADPSLYELDMVLDPIVTLWNPYNVRLKTGKIFGQPLILGVNSLNLRPTIEATLSTGETTEMSSSFLSLFDKYAEPGSGYSTSDQTYQVEMDLGNRIMEPGEVLIFTHRGPAVPYLRNESMNPSDPNFSKSGMSLTLQPGLDFLTGNSGMVLENIIPHLGGTALFPTDTMGGDVELRFRMTAGSGGQKFSVAGISEDGKEPFIGSYQVGVDKIPTEWTTDSYLSQDLVDFKLPVVFFDNHLKHAKSPDPISMVSQFNVRAQTFEQGTTFNIQSSLYQPNSNRDEVEDSYWGSGMVVNNLNGLISSSGDNGFWGPDNESAGLSDWNTHIPLFNIPRAPMTSLANFQHVPVTLMTDEPSFVVGNSLPSIFVGYSPISLQTLNPASNLSGPRNPSRTTWNMTRVDWSYLLNQTFFDSYYFSGIAPSLEYSSPEARLTDHILNQSPLPNAPYRFQAAQGEQAETILERLFDTEGDPTPKAHQEMAAHLLVDGMFNINSTSVEAWRALLGSTRKLKVITQNEGEVESTGTVYTRMSIPYSGENDEWTGFSSLTDSQLNRLAEEIVIQVKERGPFLNLADFVNRRAAKVSDPSPIHPHMRLGALGAAIQAANINQGFTRTLGEGGLSVNKSELNDYLKQRVDRDSKIAEGVPGYLTQADLLSVLAPVLSARSDTFTIRSYGETEDGTGNVVSRAWCEAVVQRMPDYQDSTKASGEPSDLAPYELSATASSYDTAPLRRKYKIIRFRWLTPEEI